MSRDNHPRRRAAELPCAELHSDDVRDPDRRRRSSHPAFTAAIPTDVPDDSARRARQRIESAAALAAVRIAAEAERVLITLIPGGCADAALRELRVEGVDPVQGGAELVVRVSMPPPSDPATNSTPTSLAADLTGRLDRLAGFLRAELAASVRRKRVPRLRFVLVPRSAAESSAQGDREESR